MKVPTPVTFGSHDRPTKEDVTKILKDELKNSERWTVRCSEALKKNPLVLFQFDRLEHFVGVAFGSDGAKILLNPVQVLCYHPKCLESEKEPVMLQVACDLHRYIVHLRKHHSGDAIGQSMDARFSTVLKNIFKKKYDGPSPFSLADPYPALKEGSIELIRRYGISRDFPSSMNYTLHWKNVFLQQHLVNTESLTFQEDDAFVSLVLQYPKKITDWSYWMTLACYSMKMYTGVSGAGLNLLRGVTNYESELEKFVGDINHPSASISSVQRWLPVVKYDNDTFHKFYLLFHMKVLSAHLSSIVIESENVKRYPVCLSVDEQEINQGTFVEDGVLHGLVDKLNAEKLQNIKLEHLAEYIKRDAPFIQAVREYRLMDLDGIFFSNVFTSFIGHALTADYCIEMLNHVIKLASSCFSCLETGNENDCVYDNIREQCERCRLSGRSCVSIVVFHVVWDMGSFQKKSERLITKITSKSTEVEFQSRSMFSLSFGGLHLAKAIVNASRNHILTCDGQNFGVNVLRALKNAKGAHEKAMNNVKACVIQGKDRQSDYLAHSTVNKTIQEALELAEHYTVTRYPEKILWYKEKHSITRMILPTGVVCNTNGDVYVLDSGASCIHVIDRSSVAKVKIIGKYGKKNLTPYKATQVGLKATSARMSNNLTDICISKLNNIFIADKSREEIIVLRNCEIARNSFSRTVNVVKKKMVVSVACQEESKLLCVVSCAEGGHAVEILNLALPETKKSTPLFLKVKVCKKINFHSGVKFVFEFPPSFGVVDESNKIIMVKQSKIPTAIVSEMKPSISTGMLYVLGDSKTTHFKLTKDGSNLKKVAEENFPMEPNIICSTMWGSVLFFIRKNGSGYDLIEYGPTVFGKTFSSAVDKFYEAICYIPPYGYKYIQKKTLSECISLAKDLLILLKKMQKEAEQRFVGRKSFVGSAGTVFSATANCALSSVNGWRGLLSRLNHFDPTLGGKVNPQAAISEVFIEHAFGFTIQQGEGSLQDMYGYLHSKKRHENDFQLRMCDLPFNTYVKTKLRDKSYQEIHDNMRSKVPLEDLWAVICCSGQRSRSVEVSEADAQILRHARLLSKSVPRRSNRAKWKEASGYAPNLLSSETQNHTLLKGDLVFTKVCTGEIQMLVVQKDVELKTVETKIPCVDIPSTTQHLVRQESLVKDQGLIAIVPLPMYEVKKKKIILSDVAESIVSDVLQCQESRLYTETEICQLVTLPECVAIDEDEQEEALNVGCSREGKRKQTRTKGKALKKTKIDLIEEEKNDEDDESEDNESDNNEDNDESDNNEDNDESENNEDNEESDVNTDGDKNNANDIEEDIESDVTEDEDEDEDNESVYDRNQGDVDECGKSYTGGSVDDNISDLHHSAAYETPERNDLEVIPVSQRVPQTWVKVVYDNDIYIGRIEQVMETGACLVRCLSMPFGIGEGEFQDMEDGSYVYDTVYFSKVQPQWALDESEAKSSNRGKKWRFIYGKKM